MDPRQPTFPQFYHAALIIRRDSFFYKGTRSCQIRSKVDKLHILSKMFDITILSTSSSVVPQENYVRFIFVLACTQGLTFSFFYFCLFQLRLSAGCHRVQGSS